MCDKSNLQTVSAQGPKRYDAINGLRAFSAVGIIWMHVYTNGGYALTGAVFPKIILSFTDLVFLFMVISGFSMCCGYYDRFISGKIDLGQFYSKRYAKIWPYFAMLCLLDIILSPGKEALMEAFANVTLLFGLLPSPDLSVIGVGWFLGLVFVFYLIFPFFCYLLSDKKRAWLSFGVALAFNLLCSNYFEIGRVHFLYSAVFFLAGGLLYLYREKLEAFARKCPWAVPVVCIALTACYYLFGALVPTMLLLSCALLAYAISVTGKGILNNPVTKFLSDISMELYLSHMVIYRVLEKLNLLKLFGEGPVSMLFAFLATLLGTVVFAVAARWGIRVAGAYLKKLLRKQPKAVLNETKGE